MRRFGSLDAGHLDVLSVQRAGAVDGVFLAVALNMFVTFASNVYVQLTSSVNITPLLPDVHGTLKPYGYACSPAVRHSPGIRFAVVVGEQAYPTVAARARANVNEVMVSVKNGPASSDDACGRDDGGTGDVGASDLNGAWRFVFLSFKNYRTS